jgi:hypothetical protein
MERFAQLLQQFVPNADERSDFLKQLRRDSIVTVEAWKLWASYWWVIQTMEPVPLGANELLSELHALVHSAAAYYMVQE